MITIAPLDGLTGVRAGFFTRTGGVSTGLYASRNCGFGSADSREAVAENRARCRAELGADALVTVHQVHSADAVIVTEAWAADAAPRADGLVTDRPGIALGVLAADCAPVLFADETAGVIGAAHAGWKGAIGGVLEATVDAMAGLGAEIGRIRAVVGPCIGAASYEVGPEFRDRFVAAGSGSADLFVRSPHRPGHVLFDLSGYVRRRLATLGIGMIGTAGRDTAAEAETFFSYRRACLRGEPDYGRNLSAIVLAG